MLEKLISIDGPDFLVLYTGVAIACIVFARIWTSIGGSRSQLEADPPPVDAVAIASLRGGIPAVIRTVIFSLWRRNLVEIDPADDTNDEPAWIRSLPADTITLTPVERAVHRFLTTPTEAHELFRSQSLEKEITELLAPMHADLRQRRLMRDTTDFVRTRIAFALTGTLLVLLGGAKLYFGLTRSKPSGYLALIFFASLYVLYRVMPRKQLTRLGRIYLRRVGMRFQWIKKASEAGRPPADVDPGLGIAIFGVGIIRPIGGLETFTRVFTPPWRFGGFYGGFQGGCGGGCGGGGGGGCGGCGGG